ncbi:hypothetical protein F7725_000784 [Dissostichus mawsoni]|uniref:Protein SEC13 homolog n=1 Tax=Dissostichus mawsoni TaxID=36200 RepID=A0A7J5ZHQ0_DISMA|nr:hypothetical protein F7725_000784 [Dissostichus mawsoni]
MVLLLKKCSGPGRRSRKSSLERLGSMSLLILAAENRFNHTVNNKDGRVFIWTCDDPAGNTWTAKLLHKFNDVVWHVSWSITGNILAVSGGDNKVKATGTGPCQVKLIYKA